MDDEADTLAAVYTRWSPLVFTLALRLLDDVDAAERVTEQVFVALPASARTPDVGRSEMARRLVELTCARVGEIDGTHPSDDESNPGSVAERLVMADALAHLDAPDEQVLRMVLDGVSLTEVAARTGLSAGEVAERVSKGLVELSERREESTDARRR